MLSEEGNCSVLRLLWVMNDEEEEERGWRGLVTCRRRALLKWGGWGVWAKEIKNREPAPLREKRGWSAWGKKKHVAEIERGSVYHEHERRGKTLGWAVSFDWSTLSFFLSFVSSTWPATLLVQNLSVFFKLSNSYKITKTTLKFYFNNLFRASNK